MPSVIHAIKAVSAEIDAIARGETHRADEVFKDLSKAVSDRFPTSNSRRGISRRRKAVQPSGHVHLGFLPKELRAGWRMVYGSLRVPRTLAWVRA